MSHVLVPYMIDLAELRGAVGSRDRKLIEAIRDKYPENFEETDDDDEDAVTLGEALERLVNGEPIPREGTGEYGEALRALVAYFGTPLKPRAWAGIQLSVLTEDNFEPFVRNGPPVPLPDYDSSSIGHVTREAIREVLAIPQVLSPKPRSSRETELKALSELTEEFEGWLRTAASHEKDLVFFCS